MAGVDPFFNNTVLLLHCDDAGLTDVRGHTVTLNGNVARSATQSKFGGYSATFDGTGDYLTIPSSTDWDFGSGDFTIEFWTYLNSNASGWFIVRRDTSTPWSPFGLLLSTGKLRALYTSGTASYDVDITGTATITTGAWHHIALVRRGSAFQTYIDGVADASGTSSTTMRTLNEQLVIGAADATGSSPNLNGYIDDLRITKGVARYTAPFAVPTATFPDAIPLDHDPFWNQTVLAMALNDTGLTDTKGHTVTLNGNVARSATQSKFGGYSAAFDGTGDYLDCGFIALDADDFTLEGWFYFSALGTGNRTLFSQYDSAQATRTTFDVRNTKLSIFSGSNGAQSGTTTLVTGQWYHIAYVKSGSVCRGYLNGVLEVTHSTFQTPYATNLWIGSYPSSTTDDFSGYVDDVRVTRGITRYTTNFTAPVAANPTAFNETYDPWIGNVMLLQHMDNTGLTDVKGHTVTLNGNAARSATQSKFGGYSATFDGTGDYLEVAGLPGGLGAGNFTIECWVRTSTVAAGYAAICHVGSGVAALYRNGATFVWYQTTDRCTSATITADTWYHVAVVRSGGVISLYVNGTASTTTYSASTDFSATTYRIGNNFAGTEGFSGYIDDLRITKGAGRYTSAFTSPSVAFANTDIASGSTTDSLYWSIGYSVTAPATDKLYQNTQYVLTVPDLDSLYNNQQYIITAPITDRLYENLQYTLTAPDSSTYSLNQQWAVQQPIREQLDLNQQWGTNVIVIWTIAADWALTASISAPILRVITVSADIPLHAAIGAAEQKLSTISATFPLHASVAAPPSQTYQVQVDIKTFVSMQASGLLPRLAIPGLDTTAETWVTNLDTSATSQFDGYGFNSYGFDGTDYWACCESGIYKITGTTDAGTFIESQITTGKVSFGAAEKKALPNVWVGVSSNQTLVLKVEAEQGTFYYDATAADPDMQMQRFDLGRGLRSSYYTFTLSALDKMELESIKFLPVPSARRVN